MKKYLIMKLGMINTSNIEHWDIHPAGWISFFIVVRKPQAVPVGIYLMFILLLCELKIGDSNDWQFPELSIHYLLDIKEVSVPDYQTLYPYLFNRVTDAVTAL